MALSLRTPRNNTRYTPWAAIAVSAALLMASGAGYRAAAKRFAQLTGAARLPRGTLARLPLTIGEWDGEKHELTEAVIRATDTEDHVSRKYRHGSTGATVSLFIGYGLRMRDLMPHRPEVCYPGAGWTLESGEPVKLPLPTGAALLSRVHEFSRGGLDTRRVTVLNYYIVDGAFYPDVSVVRNRAWKFDSELRYLAQVQIAAGGDLVRRTGKDAVQDFAAASAPVIRNLLEQAVAEAAERDSAEGGDG